MIAIIVATVFFGGFTPSVFAVENDPGPRLAIASNVDGRLELFQTDADGALLHRWQKDANGEWSKWSNLGGSLESGLGVGSDTNGCLAVFGVDRRHHHLMMIRQTPPSRTVWEPWSDLGGNLAPGITVGLKSDGRLEVFGIDGTTRRARCKWQTDAGGGWSAWEDLGGKFEPGLAVQVNRDGAMELFGVDATSGNLLHCMESRTAPGLWSSWDNLGGEIRAGFAVGRNQDGRLEVFAMRRHDATMEHIGQVADGGRIHWTAWGKFGQNLKAGIVVGQNADGRLEVFAVNGPRPDVMHRWQFHPNGSDGWSDWWSLWGSVEPYPVLGRNSDGNLELFGIDSSHPSRVQHKRQISANKDWLDWFDMDQPVFPYASRTWQTEEGLPNNNVQALAQTPDGYLWVGTQAGLARFDGLHFTIFDPANTPALQDPFVSALCVDNAGTLWIGTRHGVRCIRRGTIASEPVLAGLEKESVNVIYVGHDNSLWFGTLNGLTQFKDGKVTHYTRKEGLASDTIRAVLEDYHSNLWIGTDQGLNRLSGGEMTRFGASNGLPNESIRGLTLDKAWRLWIGSDGGMIWYNTGHFYAYGRPYGLSDNSVSVVCEDHEDNLWVGTHSGLNRFREGRFFNEQKSEGVPYDRINTIFEDGDHTLWVGSIEGLIRLTPQRFFTYNKQQGLTHNNTMCVLEDHNGALWTGTYGGGLNCLRDEQTFAYGEPEGTPALVLSLCENQAGGLWIGADQSNGLFVFTNGQIQPYAIRPGAIDSAIRVIRQDRRGALWLGTARGLYCEQGGQIVKYTTKDGLAGDVVRALCEDNKGAIWIGTDRGLSRREGGRFVNYTTNDGLSDNSITALYQDGAGALWIGTGGGGMNRLAQGHFHACTTRQGLFSDEIFAIVEDDYGWLWMSCGKGIFRVRKADLDALADGKKQSLTSFPYGKSDGMESVICNGQGKPAGWKAQDGRLWFPTTKGLVAVDPNIPLNEAPPPVYIEHVLADKKELSQNPEQLAGRNSMLVVPPGRGELEFRYTALELDAPDKTRFRYMLEGVNSDWVDAGTRREAHYDNIYPGTYRFHVTAANKDGVWNPSGATVAIELEPHYWQSWWFRCVVVLGVLGAVGGLARFITKKRLQHQMELLEQERAIEMERGRIAKDIHDDLGSSLTRIMMLGQMTQEDIGRPEELATHAVKIVASARSAVQALDEIVWAVNPENDSIDELVGYLTQFAGHIFEGTNVRCRLETPRKLPALVLPAEIRHDLFLAAKEALNNALKHSGATEVRLVVTEENGVVELIIEDNGRGFDPGAPSNDGRVGNGLANMRKRVEAIGGRFSVTSARGAGTKLTFTVVLRSNRNAVHFEDSGQPTRTDVR